MAFPQFDDLEVMVKAFRGHAMPSKLMMAFDIKAAHRLHGSDWGLQVLLKGWLRPPSGGAAGLVFRLFHRILEPESVCLQMMASSLAVGSVATVTC